MGRNLEFQCGGVSYRFSNPANEEALGRGNFRNFLYKFGANPVSKDVVEFSDVLNRIFSSGGFKTHRPAGSDEAIDPVTPAHLPIVATFCRSSSYGQVNRLFL
jgi:hypothetical protein